MNLLPYLIIDASQRKIIASKATESEARVHAKTLTMSGGHTYTVAKMISVHSSERTAVDKVL